MIAYGVGFFPDLEAQTGQALGWRRSGRVMFATSAERAEGYRRLPALGRARGIEMELLSPAEVTAKLPTVDAKGLAGASGFRATDGSIRPTWSRPSGAAPGCTARSSSKTCRSSG
jgi:glycine/D-amino acid oxidase-like deaminating enzyme